MHAYDHNTVTCPRPPLGPPIQIEYGRPAIVGSTLTLSCPASYALIGQNTSTCEESGSWVPDIETAMCKGKLS